VARVYELSLNISAIILYIRPDILKMVLKLNIGTKGYKSVCCCILNIVKYYILKQCLKRELIYIRSSTVQHYILTKQKGKNIQYAAVLWAKIEEQL